MSTESIHLLIENIQSMDGSIVGEGPKHPTSPHPEIQQEIDTLLATYNFLKNDDSYIAFLECYSGLTIDSADGKIFIDVFGFLEDVSLHLLKGEGSVVDDEGYFGFCSAVVRIGHSGDLNKDDVGLGFAFDATGKRRKGVYRSIGEEKYEWYCEKFQNWLENLVATKGAFIECAVRA